MGKGFRQWRNPADGDHVFRAGNLGGCLAMVAVVQAAGIFAAGGNAAMNIAVAKTSLSFGQVGSMRPSILALPFVPQSSLASKCGLLRSIQR